MISSAFLPPAPPRLLPPPPPGHLRDRRQRHPGGFGRGQGHRQQGDDHHHQRPEQVSGFLKYIYTNTWLLYLV